MKMMVILAMLLLATAALAQPEVEISSERDAAGKFINGTALTVTWETEADGTTFKEYPESEVGDHCSQDDDTFQEWFVPKPNSQVYWKFTFTRDVKGEYAARWRSGSDGIWSEWGSVTITKAKTPKHKD